MRQVTKVQFYASIGTLNVHPYIVSEKYPYKTEWRNPAGQIFGRSIPAVDKKYPHIYIEEYFLADGVEIKQSSLTLLDMNDI